MFLLILSLGMSKHVFLGRSQPRRSHRDFVQKFCFINGVDNVNFDRLSWILTAVLSSVNPASEREFVWEMKLKTNKLSQIGRINYK